MTERMARALWIAAVCVFALAGCSFKPAPIYTTRDLTLEESLPAVGRESLLNEMSVYHGVRYRSGGTSIEGVDCSGLVRAVFGALGVPVPRTVIEQFETGVSVSRHGIRTGDLVFFGPSGGPDHVGIALSREEVLHASSSRGVVVDKISDLDNVAGFRGARRVVRLQ
jgi:cell wall-associated NlpC family hydrolase